MIKAFKKLGQQAFSCQEDAKNALVHREAKQTFLVVDSQINKVLVNLGAGRPSEGAQVKREY
jgi:hypothetical protein